MKKNNKNISNEIWQDIESPPLSDDMLARMKPVKEQHPDIPKRVRGPQKEPLKVPVSIRLSSDVVTYFKSQGKGWQSKIDSVLHNYIKSH
ncbi:MAG TPA: hypothetical protein ENN90_14200 [Mariniphaga anaerophila]|uniref:BrnA antitoxin of type II toxin-antitoxin system n=1 Tax=Mariniphaga anaerophila TaxID=1484053 RepID=A0A831PSA1_9BACT|nr:hypothetical protein [Mariniphaga anaerophila]